MSGPDGLEALRERAQAERQSLDVFRADFSLVWKTWIARREENVFSYQQASEGVKQNMGNAGWMAGAMRHFAQLADQIRHDQARAERIRAEVQAERAAA